MRRAKYSVGVLTSERNDSGPRVSDTAVSANAAPPNSNPVSNPRVKDHLLGAGAGD
jgi:hypothetical protein